MYHLSAKIIRKPQSAAAVVAYRVGFKLRDPKDQCMRFPHRKPDEIESHFTYNWETETRSPGGEYVYQEIINEIDRTEKRIINRLFLEYEIALPREGTNTHRSKLAEKFAANLARKYDVGVVVAIHRPPNDRTGNWHAHILVTTRFVERDARGRPCLGKKNRQLDARGMIREARKAWEECLNSYYSEQGLNKRVSCESNATQRIGRIPTIHQGPPGKHRDRVKMNEVIQEYNAHAPEDATSPGDVYRIIPKRLEKLETKLSETKVEFENEKRKLSNQLQEVTLNPRQIKQANSLFREVANATNGSLSSLEVSERLEHVLRRGGAGGGAFTRLQRSLPPTGGDPQVEWLREGISIIASLFHQPDDAELKKLKKWTAGPLLSPLELPNLDTEAELLRVLAWLKEDNEFSDKDHEAPPI